MKRITMFYGKECPHCHVMLPLADRLAKEGKVKIDKLEVWHDDANAERMRKFEGIIRIACGGEFGVPAFVDEGRSSAFCGEAPYGDFRRWALEGTAGGSGRNTKGKPKK